MAKITKQSLIDAKQAVMDIDAELEKVSLEYRHGATATEAVEYDLKVAALNASRMKANDRYHNMLNRTAEALGKQTEDGATGESDE